MWRRARKRGDFFLSNLAVNDKDPEATKASSLPTVRVQIEHILRRILDAHAGNEGAERQVAALAFSFRSPSLFAALYHFFLVHVFRRRSGGRVSPGSFVLIDVFVGFCHMATASWFGCFWSQFLPTICIATAPSLVRLARRASNRRHFAVVVIAMPLLLIFVVLDRASKHKANKTAISSA